MSTNTVLCLARCKWRMTVRPRRLGNPFCVAGLGGQLPIIEKVGAPADHRIGAAVESCRADRGRLGCATALGSPVVVLSGGAGRPRPVRV
jgi:hypothetical protein